MRNYGKYQEELRAGSHSVYLMFYHLVIVTKYRLPRLKDETARQILIKTAQMSAEEEKITIKEFAIEADHAHFLLEATPTTNIVAFIRRLKGRSSRFIREHLEGDYDSAFWSPSYCLLTTGGAPIEVIKKYIENQGIK